MARTLQQMLDDCDAAIERIETGAQGWTHRNRSVQEARLKDLHAERSRLLDMIKEEQSAAASGGMARRGRILP